MPLISTEHRKTNPNVICSQRNRTRCLADAIDDYVLLNPPGSAVFDPVKCSDEILGRACDEISKRNVYYPRDQKWKVPDHMEPFMIARVVAIYYNVYRVHTNAKNTEHEAYVLGIYTDSGDDAGLYVTSEDTFISLIHLFNPAASSKEITETLKILSSIVPPVELTTDRELVAMNNGIYNYHTKQLIPFSPQFVFTSKCRTNYNPNAKNVVIHNDEDGTDWDLESWMKTLSNDPDVVEFLWKILGAIIRPNVSWKKSAWFYAESGNNGKGTLCELMRSLVGEGSYTSLSLSDMSKDFMLEVIIGKTSILTDENDVGTFIDKAANLKALISGDPVQINRKYKIPVQYQFHGFMVQCLNEMPRVKDKSDSFFRRQLFIPFDNCFTGHERSYIKEDYLHRPEVLEYAAYRVLALIPDYYSLEAPDSCKDALAEFREYNDPIRQFGEEVLPLCQWDLLPFTFLYDLYRSWFEKYVPSGKAESRSNFIKDICLYVNSGESPFLCIDKDKKIKTGSMMAKPELLIREYDLKDWYNKTYNGKSDLNRLCMPSNLNDHYRGLVRRTVASSI